MTSLVGVGLVVPVYVLVVLEGQFVILEGQAVHLAQQGVGALEAVAVQVVLLLACCLYMFTDVVPVTLTTICLETFVKLVYFESYLSSHYLIYSRNLSPYFLLMTSLSYRHIGSLYLTILCLYCKYPFPLGLLKYTYIWYYIALYGSFIFMLGPPLFSGSQTNVFIWV